MAALTAFSWFQFGSGPANNHKLRAERAAACTLKTLLRPDGRLYALGDPKPLVMTHRRNPDRFIYLGSGVGPWKVRHTPGGFAGWTAQIQAVDPSVIVEMGWPGGVKKEMVAWLKKAGYQERYVGNWRVFLPASTRASARAKGVELTSGPTPPGRDCGSDRAAR